MSNQPKTLPHAFQLQALRLHFIKTPNPAGSNRLIDLPGDSFLDTEEELTVLAAALYLLSVQYDKLAEKDRAKDVEGIRKWIVFNRGKVLEKLAGKVEPPFTAYSYDQMLRDLGAMMEELLLKTLPAPAPASAKK